MSTRILNKDFQHPADGWYHIEALGNHLNRPAGVVQVIDQESAQSIVNRFNADAQAGKLRHGSEMLIDHEHFSDLPDQETRAYGWLQELQNRDDGIYGRIRWTATGKPAVDGGDYRFFSTEYDPQDLQVLNADKTTRRVRPLKLAGLTLTNMNNNRGQKPITNRRVAGSQTMTDKRETEMTEAEIKKLVNRILKNKQSPYMNTDGTFKGGFKGCMAHMQNEEGKSEDAAQKICGYIAQNVANRFAPDELAKILNDAKDGDPTPDEDCDEATAAAHSASMAAQDESSHRAAAKAHKNAAKLHSDEDNEDAAGFHEAMAAHHTARADALKNSSGMKPGEDTTKTKNKEQMKDIAKILGLSPDADEQAVSGAITKLKNRVTELEKEQIAGLIAERKITDEKIVNRLTPVLAGLANREERLAFLDDCGFKAEAKPATAQTRVLNRGTGQVKEVETGVADEQAIARKINNRAHELKDSAPARSFESCWNQAQREIASK